MVSRRAPLSPSSAALPAPSSTRRRATVLREARPASRLPIKSVAIVTALFCSLLGTLTLVFVVRTGANPGEDAGSLEFGAAALAEAARIRVTGGAPPPGAAPAAPAADPADAAAVATAKAHAEQAPGLKDPAQTQANQSPGSEPPAQLSRDLEVAAGATAAGGSPVGGVGLGAGLGAGEGEAKGVNGVAGQDLIAQSDIELEARVEHLIPPSKDQEGESERRAQEMVEHILAEATARMPGGNASEEVESGVPASRDPVFTDEVLGSEGEGLARPSSEDAGEMAEKKGTALSADRTESQEGEREGEAARTVQNSTERSSRDAGDHLNGTEDRQAEGDRNESGSGPLDASTPSEGIRASFSEPDSSADTTQEQGRDQNLSEVDASEVDLFGRVLRTEEKTVSDLSTLDQNSSAVETEGQGSASGDAENVEDLSALGDESKKPQGFKGVPGGFMEGVNVTRLSLSLYRFIVRKGVLSLAFLDCNNCVTWVEEFITALEFHIPGFSFLCIEVADNHNNVHRKNSLHENPSITYVTVNSTGDLKSMPDVEMVFGWRLGHDIGLAPFWKVLSHLPNHKVKYAALGTNAGVKNRKSKVYEKAETVNLREAPILLDPPLLTVDRLTNEEFKQEQQLYFYETTGLREGVI